MKKIIVLSFVLLLVANCKERGKKTSHSKGTEPIANQEQSKIQTRTQNYAVVFNWATQDEKLVMENSMLQSDQLRTLWENNLVENVYYDAESKYDKFSYFPNITFTLKAKDEATVKTILDNLVVVKKGIASYNAYPVGTLWLKRN